MISGMKDIEVPGLGVITITDPKLTPSVIMDCPSHGTPMWWDYSEPGWYCAECGMWHDHPAGTTPAGLGRWMPVESRF